MNKQDKPHQGTGVRCEFCGRKLIMRLWNGLFNFRFGRPSLKDKGEEVGDEGPASPVDIYIHGSVKIRCFHRDCRKYNILNFFPKDVAKPISSSTESGKKERATL